MDSLNFFQGYRNIKRLALDVFITSVLGIFLLYVGELIRTHPITPYFIINTPEPIIVASFFLFLVTLFIVVKSLKAVKYDITYKYSGRDWPNQWIFNGKSEPYLKDGEIFIKSSRAGCLIKNYRWENFKLSFEMRFETSRTRPNQNLGLIFRAEDLDNYFMLEIIQENPFDSETITGLKPHIRFNGGWELMDIEERVLDFSEFTEVSLEANNNLVTLFYKKDPIFNWILPTHVDVNHIEFGANSKLDSNQKDLQGKTIAKGVQEIHFRNSYGMIGFRAHPRQGAIIRKLEVKPLI